MSIQIAKPDAVSKVEIFREIKKIVFNFT